MCYYSAIKNSKVVKFSMGIAEDNHPGLEKPDSQNQKDKYLLFSVIVDVSLGFSIMCVSLGISVSIKKLVRDHGVGFQRRRDNIHYFKGKSC